MGEKISLERIKRSAKEKLAHQYGSVLASYLLLAAMLIGLVIIISIALSGTVLSELYSMMPKNPSSVEEVMAFEESLLMYASTPKYMLISEVITALMGALFATLTVGFMNVCLKVGRCEKASVRDLFYVFKHNPDKVLLLFLFCYLVSFILSLPATILSFFVTNDSGAMYLIFTLVSVAGNVLAYIFSLMAALIYYLYLKDCSGKILDYIKTSISLMKGHKGRMFLLELGMIGWVLVSILSLGIATIWTVPYIEMTFAEFYRTCAGEELWISTQSYPEN